jgi:cytochrome c oxidase subunit 2
VVEIEARRYEFVPDPVVVNQGETVRLEITSTDVEHGIAITDFDIEEDLPAGETVTVEFEADDAGSHHMHCSVFCGPGHERMHGQLLVLAAEDD